MVKSETPTEEGSTLPVTSVRKHRSTTIAVKQTTGSGRGFRSQITGSDFVSDTDITRNDAAHMIHTPSAPLPKVYHSSSDEDDVTEPTVDTPSTDITDTPTDDVIKTQSKQKRRYLLFLGNISMDATQEDIQTHFKKKGVVFKELRLLTYKDTGKSRGCAFAEFENDRLMKNALKFHRSKLKGKAINIEVTCGGGGKGADRRAKIEHKNRKQRVARAKKI